MLKDIDLTNKCGSCDHFKPIENTAAGECLQHPYNDSVVHDPKHPHWIVQRSKIKCQRYNAKPQTKADHIRSMNDEELAMLLAEAQVVMAELMLKHFGIDFTFSDANKEKIVRKAMETIQQPWEEE